MCRRLLRYFKENIRCVNKQEIILTHPATAQKKYGFSQTPTAQSQRFVCLLWHCPHFLTVIFFVAMLPKHLAHCLFRFATQPKSQANPQHSNKKTLRSNRHHHFAYACIKNGGSYVYIMWHYRFASHSLFPCLCKHPTAQAVL